jgi:hypothetical protein
MRRPQAGQNLGGSRARLHPAQSDLGRPQATQNSSTESLFVALTSVALTSVAPRSAEPALWAEPAVGI